MDRNFFPKNIATKEKEGFMSPQIKLMLWGFLSSIVTVIIIFIMTSRFDNRSNKIVFGIIGLVLSGIISHFIYAILFVNENRTNQSTKVSKNSRYIGISILNTDVEKSISVDCFRYSNLQVAIMLTINNGVVNEQNIKQTHKIMDKLFNTLYHEKVKFRCFTSNRKWDYSDIKQNYLNKINDLDDKLLKETLMEIDKYNSKLYKKMISPEQNIIFYVSPKESYKLENIVQYINDIRNDLHSSSISNIYWNDHRQIYKKIPEFLNVNSLEHTNKSNENLKVSFSVQSLISDNLEIELDTLAKEVNLKNEISNNN